MSAELKVCNFVGTRGPLEGAEHTEMINNGQFFTDRHCGLGDTVDERDTEFPLEDSFLERPAKKPHINPARSGQEAACMLN